MNDLITTASPYLAPIEYDDLEAAYQAQVSALITASTYLIEKYCNRIFLADDYTDEKHNGTGLNSLFVKHFPLNSITSLTVLGTDGVNDTYTDTLNDIFLINNDIGELQWSPYKTGLTVPRSVFDCGFQNILITYNGGFTIVPPPIELLCADMVMSVFDPETKLAGIESEKLGQYFIKTRREALEQTMMQESKILNLYRSRNIR